MKKIFKFLDDYFEEVLMNILLWSLVITMTMQIFFRYALGQPLSWSDEVCRYVFIWFTFLGVSYCTLTNNHIRIDIIETLIPKLKKPFMIIGDIIIFAFLCYMIVPSFNQLMDVKNKEVTSPALLMPMWIVYASLFLALVLTFLRLVQKYYRYFTGKQYIRGTVAGETDVEELEDVKEGEA